MKKIKFITTFFVLILIILIVINPAKYISSALNGLTAFATKVLPCTLPFMILTKLVIEQGDIEKFCKFLRKPFNLLYKTSENAGYVYFMSILSGYPVGAKMISDLYDRGKITTDEACRMCSFCSNSGPMFIIGTVGALLLNNIVLGFILFLSHIISALLNGLIYRNVKFENSRNFSCENNMKNSTREPLTFGDIISDSVEAVLNVGTVICLFFIIIDALQPIFLLLPNQTLPLYEGVVELTRGCIDASTLPIFLGTIICSFVISFGGISTILQSSVMLKKLKIPIWLFSVQKFTHGLISACITTIMLAI